MERTYISRRFAMGCKCYCYGKAHGKSVPIGAIFSFLFSACALLAAEPNAPEANFLSLDQKVRIAQIITRKTAPMASGSFPVAINATIPPNVRLESFPPEAEAVAPRLQGFCYVIVEELIAIANQRNRTIVIVIPRWG